MSFAHPTVAPQASVNFTECLEMLVLSWLPRRSEKRGRVPLGDAARQGASVGSARGTE